MKKKENNNSIFHTAGIIVGMAYSNWGKSHQNSKFFEYVLKMDNTDNQLATILSSFYATAKLIIDEKYHQIDMTDHFENSN